MDYRNKATFIFFIRHDKNYMCFYEGAKIAEALTIDGIKKKCKTFAKNKTLNKNIKTLFFIQKNIESAWKKQYNFYGKKA